MNIQILSQPDDETCGPTSLHAVYKYFGLELKLPDLIDAVPFLPEGGTLAVLLGIDALKRGFDAQIFSYNLSVFDPSWKSLSREDLIQKLLAQKKIKSGKKFQQASDAYIDFLSAGGHIQFDLLNPKLLKRFLSQKIPVLAGLSATYLYGSKREIEGANGKAIYDDVAGKPTGNFVVLYKDNDDKTVSVADPYEANPVNGTNYYNVSFNRLINSILLGILTYDANLLVITPKN